MNNQKIAEILNELRERKPLIHNITNEVVTNFTANGLLSLGAAPVMAHAKEEVEDMTSNAQALILNIGTLDENKVKSMVLAGKAANEKGIPVVFDPVGAGATPYRTKVARNMMDKIAVTVLRGNAAEISHMIGQQWEIRGVEAGETGGNKVDLAKNAAKQFNTTVVITGKEDVVSDGTSTYLVENGHEMLSKITGAGCLLSAVIGAFISTEKDLLTGTVAALATYGIAAERAMTRGGEKGPGSFQIEFLNQLNNINSEIIAKHLLVKEV
ncbi:hydroxyethylthiazole kinase [Salipaludibacillus sp. CF4.18]|uniref:hydroxyethylthiazole kinase n=1 Tax=Salipaludibacillus sp. CF4.18 TaxID=3373081 RepID=UPI003EE5B66F